MVADEEFERQRLEALRGYRILDTPPDPHLDRITSLVASILRVPIVFITLIDEQRQWFKSRFGIEVAETARDIAFCNFTIRGTDLFVVEDSLTDPRFLGNPLVTGQPKVRFYAGAPLRTKEGFAIGTLGIVDQSARKLEPWERHVLLDLASFVMGELELWKTFSAVAERQARTIENLDEIAAIERERAVAARSAVGRMQEELRQSEQMDALGRLAGGIAHDFNNLLTVIIGNASFGLRMAPVEAPLHAELLEIQSAAACAAELTQQVLAFGRRQPLETTDVDLNRFVTELSPLLRRMVGEAVTLTFEPGVELWPARADQAQLAQVLFNLATNARDAMPGGGRISIRTENAATLPPAVPPPEPQAAAFVRIVVRDTGSGMNEEVRRRMFEPFFTTKQTGSGSGLGLAITYGVVMRHGGSIQVESAPGRGTEISVYLPASPRAA